MDIGEDGKPTKAKMSHLHVASDKSRGIIGKAELDLSQYGQDEFNVIKLPLQDCISEDGYIEVGLKGVPAKKAEAPSPSPSNASGSDSLLVLIDDVEKLRKENKKLKADSDAKVSQQTEKINALQTQLENTKTDLAYQSKRTREYQEEQEKAQGEASRLLRTLEAKT